MENYRKMYYILFNAITDAIESIDELEIKKAKEILKEAQMNAEEIYIASEE